MRVPCDQIISAGTVDLRRLTMYRDSRDSSQLLRAGPCLLEKDMTEDKYDKKHFDGRKQTQGRQGIPEISPW